MAKANRKQIPLCRNCHMKYHKGELVIPKSLINETSDTNGMPHDIEE